MKRSPVMKALRARLSKKTTQTGVRQLTHLRGPSDALRTALNHILITNRARRAPPDPDFPPRKPNSSKFTPDLQAKVDVTTRTPDPPPTLPQPTKLDPRRIEAGARALAKQRGQFISGADWAGEEGNRFRYQAHVMIKHDFLTEPLAAALERFDNGIHSGGL